MPLWERILAIAGAVASIVALADTFIFKGSLGQSLSIPAQVPTGLVGLLLLAMSLLLLASDRRATDTAMRLGKCQSEKSGCEAEIANLNHDLRQARDEVARIDQDLQQARHERDELRSQAQKESDLPDRVVAVLIRREASFEEIARALNLDSHQHGELMGAIATLVKSGRVVGGSLSTNYRVRNANSVA